MEARLAGLLMVLIGLLLLAALVGICRLISSFGIEVGLVLTGASSAPLIIVFQGLLQTLTGMPFEEINFRFTSSSPVRKICLTMLISALLMISLLSVLRFILH